MTDIALILSADGTGADLAVANNDLVLDDGLQSSVLHSLMANRAADPSDNLPVGVDPGGVWFDASLPPMADGSPDKWGSKLYLRVRCLATQAAANQIADDCRQALAWMLADNVAADITVTTAWVQDSIANQGLNITIAISQVSTGGAVVPRVFNYLWDSTLGSIQPAGTA